VANGKVCSAPASLNNIESSLPVWFGAGIFLNTYHLFCKLFVLLIMQSHMYNRVQPVVGINCFNSSGAIFSAIPNCLKSSVR